MEPYGPPLTGFGAATASCFVRKLGARPTNRPRSNRRLPTCSPHWQLAEHQRPRDFCNVSQIVLLPEVGDDRTQRLRSYHRAGNCCRGCGNLLPAGALNGLCPVCLFRAGLATDRPGAETGPFMSGTQGASSELAALDRSIGGLPRVLFRDSDVAPSRGRWFSQAHPKCLGRQPHRTAATARRDRPRRNGSGSQGPRPRPWPRSGGQGLARVAPRQARVGTHRAGAVGATDLRGCAGEQHPRLDEQPEFASEQFELGPRLAHPFDVESDARSAHVAASLARSAPVTGRPDPNAGRA